MKKWLLLIFTVALLTLAPFMGERFINIFKVMAEQDNLSLYILFQYRLPRVALAFIAGAGLSLSGLVFQSLFCNVLATPYTLGISASASLGALTALTLGLNFSFWIFDQTVVFAIVFSCFSLFFIYIVSRKYAEGRMSDILLIGVALNFLFSSLIMLLQFRLDYLNAFKFMHWLFGSIRNVSYEVVVFELTVLFLCVITIYFLRKELDLLSLGEEFAHSRGVRVKYVRMVLIVISSLMVGSIVAFLGPIAFIGLIVPNIARAMFGAVHDKLILATALIGGNLLVLADVFSRALFSPIELPVGIFTSLIGALVFCFFIIFGRH